MKTATAGLLLLEDAAFTLLQNFWHDTDCVHVTYLCFVAKEFELLVSAVYARRDYKGA